VLGTSALECNEDWLAADEWSTAGAATLVWGCQLATGMGGEGRGTLAREEGPATDSELATASVALKSLLERPGPVSRLDARLTFEAFELFIWPPLTDAI